MGVGTIFVRKETGACPYLLLYLLLAFADADPCVNYPGANLFPCGQACTVGVIDIDDILAILAAFAGSGPRPDPCV